MTYCTPYPTTSPCPELVSTGLVNPYLPTPREPEPFAPSLIDVLVPADAALFVFAPFAAPDDELALSQAFTVADAAVPTAHDVPEPTAAALLTVALLLACWRVSR